jgi:hypothetical protein
MLKEINTKVIDTPAVKEIKLYGVIEIKREKLWLAQPQQVGSVFPLAYPQK